MPNPSLPSSRLPSVHEEWPSFLPLELGRLGGAELWASGVLSSAPQGLRFSGINDTDFRVYLLGNPVSASPTRDGPGAGP